MSLNEYKNEVREFLIKMDSLNEDNQQKITWLSKEFELLKKAVNASERDKIKHQLYDMLYLIFEMAADNNFDLDKEWQKGRKRKQEKYKTKPTIKTSRCKLDTLRKSDYEKVKELFTNEEVRKFLGGIVSNESFSNVFHNMLTCDNNSFYWAVRLIRNEEFIGLVSLDKHHDGFAMEVSYQFMPQFWGYGYAEEVIRKIIEYAFNELKLKNIVAETQSANKASCKLLEKIGMNIGEVVSRFGAEQYIFNITNHLKDDITVGK